MIPAGALILLDTSILMFLLRGRVAAQYILAEHQLLERPERPMICSVTLGELLRLGVRRRWGDARLRDLTRLRENLVVVDVGKEEMYRSYGELGALADAAGRTLPHNGLWIAAAARVTGAVLLTSDPEFDVFHPAHIQREWVDPQQLSRLDRPQ